MSSTCYVRQRSFSSDGIESLRMLPMRKESTSSSEVVGQPMWDIKNMLSTSSRAKKGNEIPQNTAFLKTLVFIPDSSATVSSDRPSGRIIPRRALIERELSSELILVPATSRRSSRLTNRGSEWQDRPKQHPNVALFNDPRSWSKDVVVRKNGVK